MIVVDNADIVDLDAKSNVAQHNSLYTHHHTDKVGEVVEAFELELGNEFVVVMVILMDRAVDCFYVAQYALKVDVFFIMEASACAIGVIVIHYAIEESGLRIACW